MSYLDACSMHVLQEECIDSLVRKAGYQGRIDASLRKRIRLTRYQVSAPTRSAIRYLPLRDPHMCRATATSCSIFAFYS